MYQFKLNEYQKQLLKEQNYDEIIRSLCSELSGRGINNYFHYSTPRQIDINGITHNITINHNTREEFQVLFLQNTAVLSE